MSDTPSPCPASAPRLSLREAILASGVTAE
jgi:hypothetical protein